MNVAVAQISFDNGSNLLADLRARVHELLADRALIQRAKIQLYSKGLVALALLAVGWCTIMFMPPSLVFAIPALVLIGLGLTIVALSVQHDANHGAYFSSRRLNHLVGWTFDCLVGISSYTWRVKHNNAHHTYTNVFGYDDDVGQTPIAAFCPDEPAKPWHRYQHVYIWPLYCLMGLRWQVAGDIAAFFRGRVGQSRVRPPRGWDLVGVVSGKMIFLGWALVAPMLIYPWWIVLIGYLLVAMALSFAMATTFQLAHCMTEASFTSASELTDDNRRCWAKHEIESTVNFCPRNPVLTWLLGGLNFQIEHHLFPRVPHTLYPRIASVIQKTCTEYGVRYNVHPNLLSALKSHCNHLYQMGQRTRIPAPA